jgi:hypothetical protein
MVRSDVFEKAWSAYFDDRDRTSDIEIKPLGPLSSANRIPSVGSITAAEEIS